MNLSEHFVCGKKLYHFFLIIKTPFKLKTKKTYYIVKLSGFKKCSICSRY